MELTLNLGVLALRLLQQVNPSASHAWLLAPSQHPLPPRARHRVEGPAPPVCCGPPSGTPGARLAHTPLRSGYRSLPPPCFRVRRDMVAKALAVRGPGAQGNGEAGAEQNKSDGRAKSSRVTSSKTPCHGG